MYKLSTIIYKSKIISKSPCKQGPAPTLYSYKYHVPIEPFMLQVIPPVLLTKISLKVGRVKPKSPLWPRPPLRILALDFGKYIIYT